MERRGFRERAVDAAAGETNGIGIAKRQRLAAATSASPADWAAGVSGSPPQDGGANAGTASSNLWFHRLGPSVGRDPPPSAVDIVKTTPLDLSKLNQADHVKAVPMAERIARHLMSAGNRRLLAEVSGSTADWNGADRRVVLRGSSDQVGIGAKLLVRIATHCQWGCGEEKVRRLLSPRQVENVRVRLAPMGISLQPVEKALSSRSRTLTIGKDKSNDVVIIDSCISRQHCVLELDNARGAVYVVDHSTNGTFLNGKRLPQKKHGKVVLSHGDELLLKGVNRDPEFGYMVNLVDVDEGVHPAATRGGAAVEMPIQRRQVIGSAF